MISWLGKGDGGSKKKYIKGVIPNVVYISLLPNHIKDIIYQDFSIITI